MIKFTKPLVFFVSAVISISTAFAGIVNINEADAQTIQDNLKGIGKVKAEAIVDYRTKNGLFKQIEDLANVKGIGEVTIEKNRADISLESGAVKTVSASSEKVASTVEEKVEVKANIESSDKLRYHLALPLVNG